MPLHGYTFTINNYTKEHTDACDNAVGKAGIKYVCYGKEIAASGTPHLQGYLQANHDNIARFQKQFKNKCHMEKQNADSGPSELETQGVFGKPYTAIGYCMKEGDFVAHGECVALKGKGQGKRCDIEIVMDSIKEGASYDAISENHPQQTAKFGKFFIERINARDCKKQKLTPMEPLKPNQAEALERIKAQNNRQITWIWSAKGQTGKSYLAQWIVKKEEGIILEGKTADMACAYVATKNPFVVVDLSRTLESKDLGWLYCFLEKLKNGMLFSGKYTSAMHLFEPPKIVVLANFVCDFTCWSEDRYDVVNWD